MNLIKCDQKDMAQVFALYSRVVEHLQQTINYPKWSEAHPSKEDLIKAVQTGALFAYVQEGRLLGAVVLNEDPEGCYEAGDWTKDLKRGEFLVIHLLAVDPDAAGTGIGEAIVDACIALAAQKGYQALRLDVVPGNFPAVRLYEKKGFVYAGAKDLLRNIEGIPEFELYERLL